MRSVARIIAMCVSRICLYISGVKPSVTLHSEEVRSSRHDPAAWNISRTDWSLYSTAWWEAVEAVEVVMVVVEVAVVVVEVVEVELVAARHLLRARRHQERVRDAGVGKVVGEGGEQRAELVQRADHLAEQRAAEEVVEREHHVGGVDVVVERVRADVAALERVEVVRHRRRLHAELVEDAVALEDVHPADDDRPVPRRLAQLEHVERLPVLAQL